MVEEAYWTFVVFMFGAVTGSFLNVVIHRLPLGVSIVKPRSRCPACGNQITALQNIPIFSYLYLRGRCASCGARISMRYPLVEALVGFLWAGLFARYGLGAEFAALAVMVAGLVAVTFIDIDHGIIPDSMSLGGIPAGFASALFTTVGWKASLIGIVAGGGILLAVAEGYRLVAKREGMGFGDVKLLAAMGAFLGWQAVLFIIFVASVTGAAVGLASMRIRGGDRHTEIPFGPFLAFGGILYAFRGPELINWYLGGF